MNQTASEALRGLDIGVFLKRGAIIQIPESEELILGVGEGKIHDKYFFCQGFYSKNIEKHYFKELISTTKEELTHFLEVNKVKISKIFKVGDTDSEYQKDIKDILSQFKKDSDLKKVVACTTASYKLKDIGFPLLNFLKAMHLNGLLYGYWNGDDKFFGVSPEPLFIKKDKKVLTYALAGSSSKENKDQLINSQKDKREHDLVIQDIVSKIEDDSSKIKVSKTYLYEFGPIFHLRTQINFETKLSFEHLLQKMSPTSALGGYPFNKSQDVLRSLKFYQYEKDKRTFGGAFGLKNGESLEYALVAIRNICFKSDAIVIHSGAGIVEESEPQMELAEVQMKRKSIEELFL